MSEPFDKAFENLMTYPTFPWQRRLFKTIATPDEPTQLDIPTGLGKTSIIPIWLLAHLLRDSAHRPPMRLIYVVNRRTIVDQATTIAENLWEKIKQTPTLLQLWRNKFDKNRDAKADAEAPNKLSVSTLRGALADNREWMRYPHRPAIIIGTVDMIGSRLLFDAYRAGKWTKAMHAGLLGQDSLLVHDEAHLSDPFQLLLEWIEKKQTTEKSLQPMKLLAMSATGSSTRKKTLTLDEEDLNLDAVKARIHATKRLTLHPSAAKPKVIEELVKLAGAYEGTHDKAKKVIVFVREPKSAKAVAEGLHKDHGVDKARIELLTGTLRGYERDKLVETQVLQTLLGTNKSTKPLTASLFLISTSAGEVGADFDADHLICDLAPLDSMIQRLGRVNRKGKTTSNVHVLLDLKPGDKLQPFEQSAINAGQWLAELPVINDDPEGRIDASPNVLRAQRTKDAKKYQAACSPPLQTIIPHPATLDAWALTSIQDNWPLAPKLDDYLHGLKDYEPPRTALAWREELPFFFPFNKEKSITDREEREERKKLFEEWFDLCPLHPRELVNEKTDRVMDVLVEIAKDHPHAPLLRIERQKIHAMLLGPYTAAYAQKDKINQRRFCGELRDQTFILPTIVGGLSKGSLDPHAIDAVLDVADAADSLDTFQRLRIWLPADEDATLSVHTLGPAPVDLSTIKTPENAASWAAWRESIRESLAAQNCRMKPVYQHRFAEEDRLIGRLILLKPQLIDLSHNEECVTIVAHNKKTGEFAQNFTAGQNLPPECQAAITLAASWHDLGKARQRWQACIQNTAPDAEPLAKSFGKGMDPSILNHYRHEFGSLTDIFDPKKPELATLWKETPPQQRDLILHLIAAHHGRGRPIFPEGAFDPDDLTITTFHELLTPAQIARRYARLQRTYGHWGLAYLESLVMSADQAASRGEEPEDTQ